MRLSSGSAVQKLRQYKYNTKKLYIFLKSREINKFNISKIFITVEIESQQIHFKKNNIISYEVFFRIKKKKSSV